MSETRDPRRTRLVTAAGLAGGAAALVLLLGAGPAPSVLQLAGADEDVSGRCDEAEHAGDPECKGTSVGRGDDGTTSTTVDDATSTTVDDSRAPASGTGSPIADDIRSLDAAGAGTVLYAVDGGTLRLVTATPTPGWAVEVEQGAGREVELDFRSGTKRVQVDLELEDGQVRERVRSRDDADDTDVRTEDGVVDDDGGPGHDDSVDDDHSGSSHDGSDDHDDADDDDHSGSSHDGPDDDSSGSGRDHPEDD